MSSWYAHITIVKHITRGKHLARRQEIYEILHPEAKAGNIRAVGMHKALGHNVNEIIAPTFTEEVAKLTGKSQRTIQQDIQIATGLDDKASGGARKIDWDVIFAKRVRKSTRV